MNKVSLILIFCLLASISYSLDYYIIVDPKDRDSAYLYSPRQEKVSNGWEFIGQNVNPNDPKIYEDPNRPSYWRRKIGATELPYKYIERDDKENSIPKNGKISLNFLGGMAKTIEVAIKGILTPRPTGLFYKYDFDNKMKDGGRVYGSISGKRIGDRVNLSVTAITRDGDEKKTGGLNGSITFNLTKEGDIEKGALNFFARIQETENGNKFMTYLRIAGKLKGKVNNPALEAYITDVDSRETGQIKGDLNSFDRLLKK
ncbi:MAG: hypothetical protein OEZ36_04565 [Spirochaetota bacterium]|nr:hypothetical protein [Spirochaetota bacterium]